METIKFAIISPQTGPTSKLGIGAWHSVNFIVQRRCADLAKVDIEIELCKHDDNGTPTTAVVSAIDAVNEGALCIIGPCDSACTSAVLQAIEIQGCPVISPASTASRLAKLGVGNLFRMTTSDHERAEILVQYVTRLYPGWRVNVFALNDNRESYSQQLKLDVIGALDRYGCDYLDLEWPAEGGFDLPRGRRKAPSIFCGPSAEVVRAVKILRSEKFMSQVFTFGSNSNLLTREMLGAIVVADLDREDTNQLVREKLDLFDELHSGLVEPSLAHMNAAEMLVNLLVRHTSKFVCCGIEKQRKVLGELLKDETQIGLLGKIHFTPDGEMAGKEQISCLRVERKKLVRNRRGSNFAFRHIARSRPKRFDKIRLELTVGQIVAVVGVAGAVVTIIGFILDRLDG